MNSSAKKQDRKMFRARTSTKILLLLVTLFLGLAVLETILALWIESTREGLKNQVEPSYPWSMYTSKGERVGTRYGYLKLAYDEHVGYLNLPDQKTEYFTINRLGYRGEEPDPGGKKKRIVVLGGSAAFGTGLRSDEDTFAAHLERLLDGTDVINAAVLGHHSSQELVHLVTRLIDLKPDLIIAYDGWNDWRYNSNRSHLFRVQVEIMLRLSTALNASQWLSRVKWLPRILFPATCNWIFGRNRLGTPGPAVIEDPGAVRRGYAENLVKMNRIARAFKAGFLCVMQADLMSGGLNLYDHEGATYERFRMEARDRFEKEGVPWIDLNDLKALLDAALFMDRVHQTGAGYRLIAETVAGEIRRRDLLSEEPQ